MKRVADYLNELSESSDMFYELTPIEQKKLKSCLLFIYKDIKQVCDKYHLTLMLSGGSTLGAIRHKGFIPWDDDMDLMMPRNDYNKFIEIFGKELGDKYSKVNIVNNFNCPFLKIVKKGTVLKMGNQSINGILIDIFPIENAPNSKIAQKIKGFCAVVLRGIAYSVSGYKNRNEILQKVMGLSFKSKLYYNFCMFLGYIFSFKSPIYWFKLFDSYVQCNKRTKFNTIPTGRKLYSGEILPREVFFPVSKGTFEGVEVDLPNDPHTYLSNLYGDYMQLPPEHKRERHFYTEFDLGEE